MAYEEKLEKKVEEYSAELPITPINLATPLGTDELSSDLSQSQQPSTHYTTPLYPSC